MRWCRIRLVLLGLLLCVVHVVSGTCGQNFTDPASSALLSDVVIEGKVRKALTPVQDGTFSVQVAIRKKILKGAELINNGQRTRKVTIGRFQNGGEDKENCIGSVQVGRTYFFFLKDTDDPQGLHFDNLALPVVKSKKQLKTLRKILCKKCARTPTIKKLAGPDGVKTGEKLVLRCAAKAKPNPVFTWYKDGKLLESGRGVRIKKGKRQSRLQIKKASVQDGGVYECRAKNAVGEAKKEFTVRVRSYVSSGYDLRLPPPLLSGEVGSSGPKVKCATQTFCLNGGTCMHMPVVGATFCQCPQRFTGSRCERETPDSALYDTAGRGGFAESTRGQATLLYERTLIIIGIVIAVFVFVVICIASYVLAKRRRKRFEERRKRREAKRYLDRPESVDDRNHHRSALAKESVTRAENALPVSKQIGHVILQEPPRPHRISHGNIDDTRQQQHRHVPPDHKQEQQPPLRSEANGNCPDSRRRLVASSVYENADAPKPPSFAEYVDAPKNLTTAAVHPESIEMKALGDSSVGNGQSDIPEAGYPNSDLNIDNGRDDSVELPPPISAPLASQPPSEPISSSPPHYLNGIISPPAYSAVTPSSQSSSPSSSYLPPHSFQDDASSRDDDDTAAQPLLPKHQKHFLINRYDHPSHPRPFESKSDKDLTRHFPAGSKRQGSCDIPGHVDDSCESERLLKNPKVPHSNTFPKSKVNGMPSDNYLDSDDDDDALEIPYEKQLDLHISEDDLGLSKENLVNSSFSSVATPSRQASRDDPVIGLLPNASLSRPKIRKYLSEEVPASNILATKSHGLHLQDYTRSHSLDNPPSEGDGDAHPGPPRLNSTLAGSPDVETYDNVAQRPPDLYNHDYAYDPNEDVAPWDGDNIRPDSFANLTEEKDRLNRLKDVLPDQQAIPI